ncbi:hypothetical protein GCM10010433_34500 [Streptomyces pulveraceus]
MNVSYGSLAGAAADDDAGAHPMTARRVLPATTEGAPGRATAAPGTPDVPSPAPRAGRVTVRRHCPAYFLLTDS